MKSDDSMKSSELLETIIISVSLLSLLPIAYWFHAKELVAHRSYFYYLGIMLCLMGYVTYRRIKRMKAAFKESSKKGSGPPLPPYFQ